MPMVPFVERFPVLGAKETRSVTVSNFLDLPAGDYGFLEFYCNEPGCDCRRVMIDVLRPETGWSRIWATISYGWEPVEFYRGPGDSLADAVECKGPYLDPLNPQSEYSETLLLLFRRLIDSPDYCRRLERHYELFKSTVEEAPGQDARRLASRRKNRDPRRRKRSR